MDFSLELKNIKAAEKVISKHKEKIKKEESEIAALNKIIRDNKNKIIQTYLKEFSQPSRELLENLSELENFEKETIDENLPYKEYLLISKERFLKKKVLVDKLVKECDHKFVQRFSECSSNEVYNEYYFPGYCKCIICEKKFEEKEYGKLNFFVCEDKELNSLLPIRNLTDLQKVLNMQLISFKCQEEIFAKLGIKHKGLL